jgi:hypothetical protein
MRVGAFPILPPSLHVFGVTNHGARHNEAEFRNLKGTTFTAEQKNYFARVCKGQLLAGEPDIRFGDSNRKLSSRYGLGHGVTSAWISNWVSPNAVNNSGRGRPASIDEQGMQEFVEAVKAGKKDKSKNKIKERKRLLIGSEITDLLNFHFRKSQKRKGCDIDSDDDDINLSTNTINKLKKVRFAYSYEVSSF